MSGRAPAASGIDAQIDALYRLPLTEFTAARNALAKTLPKPEAARVKALAKPATIPWVINQVYWHARSIYDRLLAAGEAVRKAQVAAIERPAATPGRAQQARDRVREATEAHRKAVADAVHQAVRLASQHQVTPPLDALTRMLETLSLAANPPGPPGRLTELLQPAGFEALLGVALPPASSRPAPSAPPPTRRPAPASHDADGRRERAAALRAELQEANRTLTAATRAERRAAEEADAAARVLREAEASLARAQSDHDRAAGRRKDATSARASAEALVRRLQASSEFPD